MVFHTAALQYGLTTPPSTQDKQKAWTLQAQYVVFCSRPDWMVRGWVTTGDASLLASAADDMDADGTVGTKVPAHACGKLAIASHPHGTPQPSAQASEHTAAYAVPAYALDAHVRPSPARQYWFGN